MASPRPIPPTPCPEGRGGGETPLTKKRIPTKGRKISQAWQRSAEYGANDPANAATPFPLQTALPDGTQYRYRFTLRRDQAAAAGGSTCRPDRAAIHGRAAP